MNEIGLGRKKWPVAAVILASAAGLFMLIDAATAIIARIIRGYGYFSYQLSIPVLLLYVVFFMLIPAAAAIVIYGASRQGNRIACLTAPVWFGMKLLQIVIDGVYLHVRYPSLLILMEGVLCLAVALLYFLHVLMPKKGLAIAQLVCSCLMLVAMVLTFRSIQNDGPDFLADCLLMSSFLVAAFSLLPKKERASVPAPGANAYTAAPAGQPVYQPAPVMFCPNCGRQFPSDRRFCDQCGTPLREAAFQAAPVQRAAPAAVNPQDAPSGGFATLGFFLPAVGLILYLVWKDELPLRARSAGKGALIGVIVGASLTVLIYVAYLIFAASLFSSLF